MSVQVVIHSQAEQDMADAVDWYNAQVPALGDTFVAAIMSTLADVAENPFRFPSLGHQPEVRRALCNRFPYRIFFIRREKQVVVFRVLHGARHDDAWRLKIPRE